MSRNDAPAGIPGCILNACLYTICLIHIVVVVSGCSGEGSGWRIGGGGRREEGGGIGGVGVTVVRNTIRKRFMVTGGNLIFQCTEGLMDLLLHHQLIWKSIFDLTEQSLNIDNFKSESIPIPNVPHLRVFMRSASEPDIERPPSPHASGRKRQPPQSESTSAAQVLASSLSTKAQQPVDLLSFAKLMASLGESAQKKHRAPASSLKTGSQRND